MTKIVAPSISERAFCCPHCGAFTSQSWFGLYAEPLTGESPTPFIYTASLRKDIRQNLEMDADTKTAMLRFCEEGMLGLVDVDKVSNGKYSDYSVSNLHLSKCYVCHKVAVWVHDHVVFPAAKSGVAPNPDLPDDIRKDFEEARDIVDSSPRGAAALLRLCVQKLCKHLGQNGKNIDADIGALVAAGLSPLVQKSLDIVRVIGNEAVHPGTIDLNDEPDTAKALFEIVNAIADQMISRPKSISAFYDKLPEEKRKAIEKRDSPKTKP